VTQIEAEHAFVAECSARAVNWQPAMFADLSLRTDDLAAASISGLEAAVGDRTATPLDVGPRCPVRGAERAAHNYESLASDGALISPLRRDLPRLKGGADR
jgi:hypothetical protein